MVGSIGDYTIMTLIVKKIITLKKTRIKKINYIAAPDLLIKRKPIRKITFHKIVQHVCDAYGIKPKEAFIRTRKREILYPRQIIHYFCQRYLKMTLMELADKTKMISHATIKNSIKMVSDLRDTEYDYRARLEFIDNNLHIT